MLHMLSLSRLELLDVSDNALKILPEGWETCSSLKVLRLTRNLVQEVTSTLGDLAQLEILSLQGNRIFHLPTSCVKLKQLKNVSTSQCTQLHI